MERGSKPGARATARLAAATIAPLVLAIVGLSAASPGATAEAEVRQDAITAFAGADLHAARRHAESYLQAQPDDAEIVSLLGMVELSFGWRARSTNDLVTAEEHFSRAHKLLERGVAGSEETTRPIVSHGLGFLRMRAGDCAGAVSELDRALTAAPHANGFRWRAECHLRSGAIAAAVADLENAIRLQPDDLDSHLRHADLLQQQGRDRDAMAALWSFYRRRLVDQPVTEGHWRTLNQTAQHALRTFAIDQARKAFEEARRIFPTRPLAHHSLGVVLYRQGELAKAAIEFDAALASAQIVPALRAEASFFRGLIAKHERDFAAARRHLSEAVRLAPNKPEALQNLAVVAHQLGDAEFARAMMKRASAALVRAQRINKLERAIDAAPHRVEAYQELIELHLALSDRSAATAVLGTLEQRMPTHPRLPLLTRLVAGGSDEL